MIHKIIISVIILLFMTGCGVTIRSPVSFPKPKQAVEKVMTDVPPLVTKTMSEMPGMYGWMVVLFVGGLIFWGITKSKWGWIIPSSAVAGMTLIVTFARYEKWIGIALLIVALAVLIYKAREYQKERNENRKLEGVKNDSISK